MLKPLDDLADAMIYPVGSVQGQAAREALHIQNPNVQQLPDRIDAFYTRDVTSGQPWERVQGVQGGFLVARPDLKVFSRYQQFILEANYTGGRGPTSGWGGLGYGGFQGAMAYQVFGCERFPSLLFLASTISSHCRHVDIAGCLGILLRYHLSRPRCGTRRVSMESSRRRRYLAGT